MAASKSSGFGGTTTFAFGSSDFGACVPSKPFAPAQGLPVLEGAPLSAHLSPLLRARG